jgi:hypothetical protein
VFLLCYNAGKLCAGPLGLLPNALAGDYNFYFFFFVGSGTGVPYTIQFLGVGIYSRKII